MGRLVRSTHHQVACFFKLLTNLQLIVWFWTHWRIYDF
jgi:hypothetical protein